MTLGGLLFYFSGFDQDQRSHAMMAMPDYRRPINNVPTFKKKTFGVFVFDTIFLLSGRLQQGCHIQFIRYFAAFQLQ
jgi:hypothetical protein